MPPRGRPPKFVLPERTLVVDNGAYTIKAGFASEDANVETDCIEIPNCIAKAGNRTWVGGQLSNCTDFAEMVFRRPVQKGYLVNWEAEREIWDQAFFEKNARLHVRPPLPNRLCILTWTVRPPGDESDSDGGIQWPDSATDQLRPDGV